MPRGGQALLDPQTKAMLKGHLPGARVSLQPAKDWSIATLHVKDALAHFGPQGAPEVLQAHMDTPDASNALLAAFAGMLAFLNTSLLDQAVLSLRSVGELYPAHARLRLRMLAPPPRAAGEPAAAPAGDAAAASPLDSQQPLVLDGAALSNLEVSSPSD